MVPNTARALAPVLGLAVVLIGGCDRSIQGSYGQPVKLAEYHHVLVGRISPGGPDAGEEIGELLRKYLTTGLGLSGVWQRGATRSCWRPVEILVEDVRVKSAGEAGAEAAYQASCRLVLFDPLTERRVGTARVASICDPCPALCPICTEPTDAGVADLDPVVTGVDCVPCDEHHCRRRAVAHLAAEIVQLLARHKPPPPPEPAIASGC